MNPPSKHSMKEVPRKFVTLLAALALPKCMVPVKYVTRFTAMPNVVNLSKASTPDRKYQKISLEGIDFKAYKLG